MKSYIVNYDLRKPGRNYNDLYEALRKFPNWCRVLESCWVVKSSEDAPKVLAYLRAYVDSGDGLFVVAATRDAAWVGLDKVVSDWLQTNL